MLTKRRRWYEIHGCLVPGINLKKESELKMFVTISLLTTQVVCVGLVICTVLGWRKIERDDKHQVTPSSSQPEN